MSSSKGILIDTITADSDVIVVDANKSSIWFDFRELWRYRELILIFAIRDIKVRYRQTVVGIAWTVLQPLAQMLAFGVLKKILVAQPMSGQIPDDVTMFCGLILYQLFSGIVGVSTNCMVDNRQVVTKVYFPRIALLLSSCLRPLLDFSIGLLVLTILMLWFAVPPSVMVLLSPLVVLGTVVVGLSLGLWLSALNAHYRDFSHIVPFLLQLGLIVSPVAYDSAQVPAGWRWLYFLNPMAALLDEFRWAVLGTGSPGWDAVLISLLSTSFLLVSGAWYFHRVDRFMADSI